MGNGWPFSDPENLAVITVRQIVREGQAILHVVHDEDGDWQFLTPDDAREEDAMVVALRRIVSLDPTLAELADLPPGWRAWRGSPDDAWRRERTADASRA